MKIFLVIFIIGCTPKSRPVTESESKEIEAFINSFYDFLDTYTELESVKKWYLNNEIVFFLQNNANIESALVSDNSEKEFYSLITTFFTRYGKRESKELVEITFEKYVYDIIVADLFVVNYRVKYERVKTTETFFIKKDGTQYKVYWYFINFYSENDLLN